MKRIVLILMLLLLPVSVFATDAQRVRITGGYEWLLNGSAITATGNSYTMVGINNCNTYTACITTSSTTNMTAAFKVGWGTTNVDTVKTVTLSADGTQCFGWSFPTPSMFITFTITTGQVDQVKVTCNAE